MSHLAATAGWMLAATGWAGLLAAMRLLSRRGEAVRLGCHELRGPLAAVRLGVELEARAGGASTTRMRALELELDRAAAVVEDLTQGSPGLAQAGWCAVSLSREVELASLVGDCVEAAQALALVRGIELRGRWSGAPAHVLGERPRIAQAIGNLIANALEHGAGPVEVSGRATHGAVRIEVVDAGPGLPAPVATLARRRAGRGRHGYGLAVACSIAAAHGGRLAAAPSERGARLVLELPPADGRASTAVPE